MWQTYNFITTLAALVYIVNVTEDVRLDEYRIVEEEIM